jgi:hypothetical protein
VPFDEIFKQIEDNLTGNVKQFKDTGGGEGDEDDEDGASDNKSDASDDASDDEDDEDDEGDESDEDIEPAKATKASKATKKTKKTDKKPVKPEESEVDEESEAEDNDSDEESEAEDEESEDEDEESEADDNDSEAEDEDDEEESEADASDDNKNEIEEKKIPITVLKEQVEPDYNKINNVVDIPDIPLTKYNDETLNQQSQEISFKAFSSGNQENKQDSESEAKDTTREAPKEPFETDNIRKEWNSIKDDYLSLSQGNAKYAETKYENDNDDAISVMSVASERSVASNITDISLIKKIHIKEASNKTKKPSFF